MSANLISHPNPLPDFTALISIPQPRYTPPPPPTVPNFQTKPPHCAILILHGAPSRAPNFRKTKPPRPTFHNLPFQNPPKPAFFCPNPPSAPRWQKQTHLPIWHTLQTSPANQFVSASPISLLPLP